jgi:hypothetical protein
MREIWMRPAPSDSSRIAYPGSLGLAMAISVIATLVFGVLPGVGLHFADMAQIFGAFGG